MLTALVVRRRGLRTLKRTENIEDRLNIIHWSQGSFRRRWYDAASDNPRTQLHYHAGYAVWLSTSCTEKFAHDLSGATSNPIWVWSFSLSAHTNARFAIHAKIIEHTTILPRARNTRTQQLLVTSSQFLEFSISRNFWRLDFTVTLPCCIPSSKFHFQILLDSRRYWNSRTRAIVNGYFPIQHVFSFLHARRRVPHSANNLARKILNASSSESRVLLEPRSRVAILISCFENYRNSFLQWNS